MPRDARRGFWPSLESHARRYAWESARRERLERRSDGKMDNSRGEGLPIGVLIACGLDISEKGPADSDLFGGL